MSGDPNTISNLELSQRTEQQPVKEKIQDAGNGLAIPFKRQLYIKHHMTGPFLESIREKKERQAKTQLWP